MMGENMGEDTKNDIELLRVREKVHELTNKINTIQCRTEMLEDSMKDIHDTRAKFEILETKVTSWMETTTEYRKSLCQKLDIITDRVSNLPCSERRGLGTQVKVIWGLIVGVIILIISDWIRLK